jgi:hypothetical protein
LTPYRHAALVLRWFFDDTRMGGLARDNKIAVSTAYAYRDEAIAVLALADLGYEGEKCRGLRRPGSESVGRQDRGSGG